MLRNPRYMVPKVMFDSGSRAASGWLWLFAIVAVGSFVGLLFYLDQYEKGKLNIDRSIDFKEILSEIESEVEKKVKNIDLPNIKLIPKELDKQKFDFYKLLPKFEVIVPEQEENTEREQLAPTKKTSVKQKSAIFLQAGSFKGLQAADRMKANLALLGINSFIESVTLKELGRWHRVRVGPFSSKREMNKIRGLLRSNSIEPIAVKVKH